MNRPRLTRNLWLGDGTLHRHGPIRDRRRRPLLPCGNAAHACIAIYLSHPFLEDDVIYSANVLSRRTTFEERLPAECRGCVVSLKQARMAQQW